MSIRDFLIGVLGGVTKREHDWVAEKRDLYRDQVRDTCRRAEKAERELRDAKTKLAQAYPLKEKAPPRFMSMSYSSHGQESPANVDNTNIANFAVTSEAASNHSHSCGSSHSSHDYGSSSHDSGSSYSSCDSSSW